MYRAQYLGTVVAVKVLKDTNAVALGDFRCDALSSSGLLLICRPHAFVQAARLLKLA